MEAVQDVTAAPSSAPETAAPETPVENFTDSQRDAWLKGDPIPETAPKTGDPASPKPGEQASEGEQPRTAAAPDTATQQEPKQNRRKLDAEARIQQLLRENADLKQRRLETTAAPSTAAPEKTVEQPVALKKPNIADFTGENAWEEYESAKDAYYEARAKEAAQAAVQADRKERETAAQHAEAQKKGREFEASWGKRVSDFTSSHPEAADFMPAVQALVDSGIIPERSFLDEWISRSKHGPAILWHFSQNPSEIVRIGELHPVEAAEELVKLTLPFESKGPVPVPQRTSVLPKPPSRVSGKSGAVADEVEAALQAPDSHEAGFRNYMEAANRKDLAARKG